MTDVFLDGEIIDDVESPEEIRENLLEKRRNGELDQ